MQFVDHAYLLFPSNKHTSSAEDIILDSTVSQVLNSDCPFIGTKEELFEFVKEAFSNTIEFVKKGQDETQLKEPNFVYKKWTHLPVEQTRLCGNV